MDQLLCGVAFAPSDEEIRSFLAARLVTSYPCPTVVGGGCCTGNGLATNKKMKSNNKFALYWAKDGRYGLCIANCLAYQRRCT